MTAPFDVLLGPDGILTQVIITWLARAEARLLLFKHLFHFLKVCLLLLLIDFQLM